MRSALVGAVVGLGFEILAALIVLDIWDAVR